MASGSRGRSLLLRLQLGVANATAGAAGVVSLMADFEWPKVKMVMGLRKSETKRANR